MRPILSLAAWNWRMARRPYGILCAVFAVQQLIVLLYQAQVPIRSGTGWPLITARGFKSTSLASRFCSRGCWPGLPSTTRSGPNAAIPG